MVPASSAQREPSMEEILASIRRIIEDNDTGRAPSDDAAPAQDAADATESTVIEVDAFRSELRTPPVEPMETVASPPSVPDRKPATLADVKAQIVEEARAAPAQRWTPAGTAPVRPEDFADETPQAANQSSPVSAHSAVPAWNDGKASAPDAVHGGAESASVPAIKHASADTSSARQSILSERAERKVSAAFGELSDAFAMRSQKTFDDMAEEMMRPMLQDWLDNNLPVLVERLVREEIERVARG